MNSGLRTDVMRGLWRCLALCLLFVLAGCGGSATPPPDRLVVSTDANLVSLLAVEVTPALPSVAQSSTLALTAIAVLSNGERRDVSALDKLVWRSSDTALAEVSAEGLVTAKAAGEVTLTATLLGVVGRTVLRITDATLSRLEILPTDPRLAAGTRLNLQAIGHYSDGSRRELTSRVTWASSDVDVAPVAATGALDGVASGSATVVADFSGLSTQAGVTVSSATLMGLRIEPPRPDLLAGGAQALRAWGLFSDGSTQDLTDGVRWESRSAEVAVVGNGSSAGQVIGLGLGSVEIVASRGAVSTRARATVRAPALLSLEVSPPQLELSPGQRQPLQALGHFDDGSVQDLTTQVVWRSTAATQAMISNAPGSTGLVTALAAGDAGLGARLLDTSGRTLAEGQGRLRVTAAALTNLVIEPPRPRLARGTAMALRAVAHYADGGVRDVTSQVRWRVADSDLVRIDAVGRLQASERLTTAAATTVTAELADRSASVSLGLSPARLQVIDIEIDTDTPVVGTALRLRAMGGFSDGSRQDLSDQVVWASSQEAVAVIAGAAELLALATGETRITASLATSRDGAWAVGSRTLSVVDATLQAVEIDPATQTLAVGSEVSLQALGVFDDGNGGTLRQDISRQVSWRSADAGVARVDNGDGRKGRLHTLGAGETRISAHFGGFSSTLALTVSDAALERLDITSPDGSVLAGGERLSLTVTGTYADGRQQDLSEQVTWSSSDPSLARVSNVMGSRGRVTAIMAVSGGVDIRAQLAGRTATQSLSIVDQPQRPVSLVLWAEPNLLLSDGSETTAVQIQLQAADPAQTVADGTAVDVRIRDGQGVVQTSQVTTRDGRARVDFTPAGAGLFEVWASLPDGGPVQVTSLRVSADLGDGLSAMRSTTVSYIDGELQPGGSFSAFAFNASNRDFRLLGYLLCDGLDATNSCPAERVLFSRSDPNADSGGLLAAGERAGFLYRLADDRLLSGLSVLFVLEEPQSARPVLFRIDY